MRRVSVLACSLFDRAFDWVFGLVSLCVCLSLCVCVRACVRNLQYPGNGYWDSKSIFNSPTNTSTKDPVYKWRVADPDWCDDSCQLFAPLPTHLHPCLRGPAARCGTMA